MSEPFDGWRRIRTFESVANRFTVCPLWPLGNPSLNRNLLYMKYLNNASTFSKKIKYFFRFFYIIGEISDFRGLPDTFCNSHKALICVR